MTSKKVLEMLDASELLNEDLEKACYLVNNALELLDESEQFKSEENALRCALFNQPKIKLVLNMTSEYIYKLISTAETLTNKLEQSKGA